MKNSDITSQNQRDIKKAIIFAILMTTTSLLFVTYNSEMGMAFASTEEQVKKTTQQNVKNKQIVQQGIATSSPDPLPGHESHQSVTILRLKGDNSLYDGTLSFTASKPVEVQIIYRNMTTSDNNTPPPIPERFGTLSVIPLGAGQGQVTSSLVIPQYPEEATSFSASLPFAGNGLALHNVDGDQFVATYTVVADVHSSAERADQIEKNPPPADDEDEDDEDEDDDDD